MQKEKPKVETFHLKDEVIVSGARVGSRAFVQFKAICGDKVRKVSFIGGKVALRKLLKALRLLVDKL